MGGALGQLANMYVKDKIKRADWERRSAAMPRYALRGLCASFGKRPVNQLGEAAIGRWLESISHLGAGTRRNHLSAVRGFTQWLVRKRHLRVDPCASLPKIRKQRTVVHTLSRPEWLRLWATTENPRDRALLALLFGVGLRCCEVSRARVEDWDQSNGFLIVEGKGHHERLVPIIPETAHYLRVHIAEEPRLSGPLFPSKFGGALKPDTIGKRVAYLMYNADIKTGPLDGKSAHTLRRTAATETLDCGGVRVTQTLLGHADLSSMHHYIARGSVAEMADAVAARFVDDPKRPAA